MINSALVMQDFETDSYWSIMSGDVIGGKLKGTKLKELPVSEKIQWKDWKKKHPDTVVLSVNGREDLPRNVYDPYFDSSEGFRGTKARDKRLKTKEPVFTFQIGAAKFAVPHKAFKGGKSFDVSGEHIFLYRPKKAAVFYSTIAYQSSGKGFALRNGKWVNLDNGATFNPQSGKFEGPSAKAGAKLNGMDTFWYTWSLNNPDTNVLGKK